MKKLLSVIFTLFIILTAATAFAADIEAPPKSEMANSPNATREKFCDLAYNMLSIRMGTPLTDKTNIFTDTDKAEINTLASLGIIDGRGNGIFDPDGLITREEAARILCSMMDYMCIEDMEIVDETFKDYDTVSDWAKEYVAKVGRNEIMSGNGDGYTIDGYDAEKNIHYIDTPIDTFHLYNSDFGPHQNYTEWQTKMTLYTLSNRLSEKMEGETVTELGGGVTLADNWKYTYAEKDGHVTFCMPHGDKYFLVTMADGQPILGHGADVYNLATGKRLMELRHNIYNMNNVYVVTKATYDMRFEGLPNLYYYYEYAYDGSFIEDITMDSEGKAKELTASNGDKHYVFKNYDEGQYMTEAYSMKPVINGKESISQAWEDSPYIICSETRDETEIGQVYNFDGKKLYEHEGKFEYIAKDDLSTGMLVCFDGDNSYAARIEDGEKLFDVKGTSLFRAYTTENYFRTYDENTKLSYLYRYDGGEKDEVCDGFDYLGKWGSFIEINRYGEDKSYMLTNDLQLMRIVDGNFIRREKDYYVIQRGDEYIITDTDWNEKIITDDYFYQNENSILTYPREGEGVISAYDAATLDLVWSGETTMYTKAKFPQITEHYLLTEKGGELYLNNINTGASAALEPITQGQYFLTESDGIVGVDHKISSSAFNGDTTLYNENCQPLGSFSGGSLDWNDKYVIHAPGIWYGARYVYDLSGNDTGIAADQVCYVTVNGRKLIIAYDKYADYLTKVYDYDTHEYLFTLKGEAVHSYDNYIYTEDKDGKEYYYDENGREIATPEEE